MTKTMRAVELHAPYVTCDKCGFGAGVPCGGIDERNGRRISGYRCLECGYFKLEEAAE